MLVQIKPTLRVSVVREVREHVHEGHTLTGVAARPLRDLRCHTYSTARGHDSAKGSDLRIGTYVHISPIARAEVRDMTLTLTNISRNTPE